MDTLFLLIVCYIERVYCNHSSQNVSISKALFGMLFVADFKLRDSLCNEIFILGKSLDGSSSCYCGNQMLV
jgi:hypothetical protein